MNKTCIILLSIAVVLVDARILNLAKKGNPLQQYRILGGSSIPIEEAPYFVQIDLDREFWIGGSIVNENHIVTTAYNVYKYEPDRLLVRAGSDRLEEGGTVHNVTDIRLHDLYQDAYYTYNVAVLTISPSLNFDSTRRNISMAEIEPRNGTNATIFGFGNTYFYNDTLSSTLQSTTIKVISRENCGDLATETDICGGDSNNSACMYDEGGPLVVDGQLAGITAFSVFCGTWGQTNTFTSVALVREWILKNI